MSSSREEILNRIRRATRDVPQNERPGEVPVGRGYRKHDGTSSREEIIERFVERTSEYEARVRRVDEADLPREISDALRLRGVERVVVPSGLPEEWIPKDVEPLRDGNERLTNRELDDSDGVLSGCSLGIAQTGTIVLDSGEGQGRRALTLLPDYHLCVIKEDQIVGLVPEAFEKLTDTVKGEGQAITFISGPSATSDIELNRVEGVHGPRTLEVLVTG